MSAHAIALWASLGAWLIVFVLIIAQIVRAIREALRIARRLDTFGDLPVFAAAERAEADVARVEAALGRLEPLLARAQAALAEIRRGPVTPAFAATLRRVRAEFAAFRAAAAR